MVDVFLVASKGIPARYGGFETFVERLVRGRTTEKIKYHVSCMAREEKHFEYENADCFQVKVPLPGAAGRILHVSRVLSQVTDWKKAHPGNATIVYILGCRIGPLLKPHADRLRKLGVKIYVNPDGLEWKRAKWKGPFAGFLHFCEKCLVQNADLVICDSEAIETYIHNSYGEKVKETTFIAYGADVEDSTESEENLLAWYQKYDIRKGEYYLIVGRFVPDNNYETMLREFMASNTEKDLVIISNVEQNKFYEELRTKTRFTEDKRIKFVGTVYQQELLKKIRENAFAYIHGHEVGGTNPSLLEALGATKCNLLLGVDFNRQVALDAALYWDKEKGSLTALIDKAEQLSNEEQEEMGRKAKQRIRSAYSWEKIVSQYESLFLKN